MVQKFIKIIDYDQVLEKAFFIKRYKRFFVDCYFKNQGNCQDNSQENILAHTNNTGSMLGLTIADSPVLISKAKNPKRKLAWTLEAICPKSNLYYNNEISWVGVNTSLPNYFLKNLFNYQLANEINLLPFTEGYDQIQMEVKYDKSRLDALICSTNPNKKKIWIECKNVSLVEDCVAFFPDAPSERAIKHLETLEELVAKGDRALMLYVVQRMDAKCFYPADFIDEKYAKSLFEALEKGVEICIIQLKIVEDGVYFAGLLPFAHDLNN